MSPMSVVEGVDPPGLVSLPFLDHHPNTPLLAWWWHPLDHMRMGRPTGPVVGGRVVFSVGVCVIVLTRVPIGVGLPLLCPTSKPAGPHTYCPWPPLPHGVASGATCSAVASLEWSLGLWVAHCSQAIPQPYCPLCTHGWGSHPSPCCWCHGTFGHSC